MSAYEFNLIKYSDRLREAGVPKEQALVHAQLLSDVLQHLVTKEYLKDQLAEFGAALEARIDMKLEQKLEQLESRMDLRHERLRGELLEAIGNLGVKFAESRVTMVSWIFAAMFLQGGFIVGLLKLIP